MFQILSVAHRFDTETLLAAYRCGVFPMAQPGTEVIHWITSTPRFVLPLDGLKVPKSLVRVAKQVPFDLRVDTAFDRVIRSCAEDRGEENPNWISPRMIRAYELLHKKGFAHSIEAFKGGVLVGGLYGVSIGGAFFGESMFSRRELGGSNSSKLCLLELVRVLRVRGFTLLDSQEANDHMQQFGGIELPLEEYVARLQIAVKRPNAWSVSLPESVP
ncbi:MAG: leucyl/phenylalanyl-tRNA--protein transferase [Planctomycetota bacterium]|nr:MAG: leucyl/phenylalanyl-tRNA--protein transferase [Planctomycetota bacterium]RLS92081.1 MAG: leucyl/phenylalanyl-tRNA--protein transferase [Planctomycetota bacterium]